MRSYKLDRLINNSKIWIIIVLPLTIMIVMFGYLVFQINSISVTLNAVLEQDLSFYETKIKERSESPQVEENSNNNGTNSDSISEQLLVNNISSTTSYQSQESEIDSSDSGQNMSAITSPFKIITDAIIPEPFSILSVIIRTAIIATLVFIIVKWLGGKGIGQLSPFGLLIVVGLGSAIGDPMIYKEISIPQAMAAVIIAVIFFKVIDYLTLKSRRFRESIEPKPILLVEHGSIVNEGLKKAKMDMADFETELRLRGLEDASEIKYARLESKGKISFIMKEKMRSN
jgi:hypothetical protein